MKITSMSNKMQELFKNIKGDRLIWAIAALLAIFSFLPVYSAASNLLIQVVR
jgi:cell division protein FtsW